MPFNTGNPVGSIDPRDLLDNAVNLDEFANGTKPTHPDRLGVARRTLAGMEAEHDAAQLERAGEFDTAQTDRADRFDTFLAGSAYYGTGVGGAFEDYAAGIQVTARNQAIRSGGEFWRVSAQLALPYTTTGAGMPEAGAFVSAGDAVLRQDLANSTDPLKGAGQVGWKRSVLAQTIGSVRDYLNASLVSIFEYANLVTDKPVPSDPSTWDWTAALNKAIEDNDHLFVNVAGTLRISNALQIRKSNFSLIGLGQELTEFHFYNQDTLSHVPAVNVNPLDADLKGITLRGFAVRGNATSNNTDGFGVQVNWRSGHLYAVRNVVVEDVKVSWTPSAGIVARECENVTISRCTVEDTYRDAIQLAGVENFLVSECRVLRPHDDGIAAHSGYTGRRVIGRILGNYIRDVQVAKGISIGGGRDVTIANNDVIGSYFNGIDIYNDTNFADARETPARIIVTGNKVLNSRSPLETTNGAVSCIFIHSSDDTRGPDEPWVEYENRVYAAGNFYETAHIIISNNILGTNEDAGKTINGVTYVPRMRHGLRMQHSVRKLVFTGNHIYNARFPIQVENTGGVDEYIAREMIIAQNTIERFQTAIVLSGDTYNDTSTIIANNIIDGMDLSGTYTTRKAMTLFAARNINFHGNTIKNTNAANDVSNTRMDASRNTFVNAVQFGSGRIVFDPATNTLTNSDALAGSRNGYTATIPAGGEVVTFINVTGAEIGDFAQVSFSQSLSGCAIYGWVQSAGVLNVLIRNPTASSVTLPTGNIIGRCTKATI